MNDTPPPPRAEKVGRAIVQRQFWRHTLEGISDEAETYYYIYNIYRQSEEEEMHEDDEDESDDSDSPNIIINEFVVELLLIAHLFGSGTALVNFLTFIKKDHPTAENVSSWLQRLVEHITPDFETEKERKKLPPRREQTVDGVQWCFPDTGIHQDAAHTPQH